MKSGKRWKALAWDDRPDNFLDDIKGRLQNQRVDVEITNQIEDFDAIFRENGPWDFLILDVIDNTSDPEYASRAGVRLAANIRRANADIPIVFLTDDESIILSGEITTSDPILQRPKSYPKGMLILDILEFIRKTLEPYDYRKVFLIYGHGKKSSGFKDKVTHALTRCNVEPVLLSPEQVMDSISNGLVETMKLCGAFVAICTPDDKVGEDWYQPRQNVLLEIGMAMALSNGFKRLVILQRWGSEPDSQAKLPSDLGGAFTIKFYDEHDEAVKRMISALETRKIEIQHS